ncbi:MAG TPA: hypothetical protein VFN35_28015, partial [Ktedonobacteraceae bacterium]|nr:hypothetical protein [Ktedonobacteraceae bacterium]
MVSWQERLQALERQVERLERIRKKLNYYMQRYWEIKLLIFVGGCIVVIIALLLARWLGILCALLGVVAFGIVSHYHSKVNMSLIRHQVFLKMKKTQLARMRLDWDNLPPQLESELINHPFEIDLDITGECSLQRLLNTAVSFEGGQRLSRWLLTPALDKETIRQRQTFIQELLPMTGFRNKLMLHALHATRYTEDQYDESSLLKWLSTEKSKPVPVTSLYIPILACATTILLLVLFFLGMVQPWSVLFPILFSAAWFLS